MATVGACIADAVISGLAAAAAAATAAAAYSAAAFWSVAETYGLVQTVWSITPAVVYLADVEATFAFTVAEIAAENFFGLGVGAFAGATVVVTPLGYTVIGGISTAFLGGIGYGIYKTSVGSGKSEPYFPPNSQQVIDGDYCTFDDVLFSGKLQCRPGVKRKMRMETGSEGQDSMSSTKKKSVVRRRAKHVRNKKHGSTKSVKVAKSGKRMR